MEHARRASRRRSGASAPTAALFASPGWAGRPALVTRCGLHRDTVMVGHCAPDRMSYTAMGDGVNLASRLEGLNKHYGTTILVSEAVRQAVGDGLRFRLVDVPRHRGPTGTAFMPGT